MALPAKPLVELPYACIGGDLEVRIEEAEVIYRGPASTWPPTTQEKPMKKKRIQLQLDEELAGELRHVLDVLKLTWDQWGAQAARVFVQDGLSGTWPDKNVLEPAADVRIFDDRVDENGFAKVQFQVNPDVYLRLRDELAKSGKTWDQWGKEAIEACFSPSILYLADPTSAAPDVDVVELIMGIFKRWGQRVGPVWDAINAGEPQRRHYIEQLLAGEASLDPPPKPPRTRAKAWVDYSEDA